MAVMLGVKKDLRGGSSGRGCKAHRCSAGVNKLETLRELIRSQGGVEDPTIPAPVVSVEEFFDGNDDLGSIGCNLFEDHPGMKRFYEVLKSVEARPEVQAVVVEIYEIMEGDGEWPFSERVYVLTSAGAADVEAWTTELEPSEVEEGWVGGRPARAPEVSEGHRVWALWWD